MKESRCNYIWNINWGIISLVIFVSVMMIVMYMPDINAIDTQILTSIRTFLNQYPSYIPFLIADFGIANFMVWPQLALVSVLIAERKFAVAFISVFFVQAITQFTMFIKDFVCRERPVGANYPDFSFPSLHSSGVMCLYGIIIHLILIHTRNKFWRYFLVTVFSLYILLIAVSRLWRGVHFLTDVIAGLFLGLLFVNLYIIFCKICKFE